MHTRLENFWINKSRFYFFTIKTKYANLNREVFRCARIVNNILRQVQIFNAFVVGVFRTDFAQLHDRLPVYRKGILKPVKIPILEQSHIQAHMCWGEPIISPDEWKKSIEVPDIIHVNGCGEKILIGLESIFILFQDCIDIILRIINNATDTGVRKGTIDAKCLQGTRRNIQ